MTTPNSISRSPLILTTLLALFLLESPIALAKPIKRLDYEGFTAWVDCARRGQTRFQYTATADSGSFPRLDDYTLDPNVPKKCQQKSTRSYGRGYDRGHLVSANHMDFSGNAIMQSNYMTNILPQVHEFNAGAWLATEEIVECYRDLEPLQVFGGVIWGTNKKNDYFVKSHGVRTPDFFWKVVVRSSGEALAWLFPNSAEATYEMLDQYLIVIADLEPKIKLTLPVDDGARYAVPTTSWALPEGCNKG